ncbi:ORF1 protein [Bondarzewia berkeleyi negative-strand RNA virus 1]|uniref:ORF1 protein n=1 Tax=Bondarzewia berkeleyi negative-strand RNA virus 1 TaxID=2768771 RepID=A0AAE7MCV6_9MONO|nr:ORF1 protein [Bondarzewia berkeleyi negative-strand RNA virus 1]QNQ73375.1 ORF1 protein [Bondarzewia berkeleyi negative-strand RNA virus 1]
MSAFGKNNQRSTASALLSQGREAIAEERVMEAVSAVTPESVMQSAVAPAGWDSPLREDSPSTTSLDTTRETMPSVADSVHERISDQESKLKEEALKVASLEESIKLMRTTISRLEDKIAQIEKDSQIRAEKLSRDLRDGYSTAVAKVLQKMDQVVSLLPKEKKEKGKEIKDLTSSSLYNTEAEMFAANEEDWRAEQEAQRYEEPSSEELELEYTSIPTPRQGSFVTDQSRLLDLERKYQGLSKIKEEHAQREVTPVASSSASGVKSVEEILAASDEWND